MKVTLWRDDAALDQPVTAAAQRHEVRSRLFLALDHDGVRGFGEVAPQPFALNGDPSFDEVLDEVRSFVVPNFEAACAREGAMPSWTRVARFAGPRAASRVALALMEMAVLDRELREDVRKAVELWPPRLSTPSQATVSALEPGPAWNLNAQVARVRVKTAPGPLSDEVLTRLEALAMPVLLDFNCSARSIADVLDQVASVRHVATVAAVEQPFAAGNIVDHAALAQRTDVSVSLDEGVRSSRDLDQIVRYGAASMVCVKPPRVGGLANARTMIERARDLGLTVYLGGFFESGFARAVHRTLAENCVNEPSDLAEVKRSSAGLVETQDAQWGFEVAPSAALLEAATELSASA